MHSRLALAALLEVFVLGGCAGTGTLPRPPQDPIVAALARYHFGATAVLAPATKISVDLVMRQRQRTVNSKREAMGLPSQNSSEESFGGVMDSWIQNQGNVNNFITCNSGGDYVINQNGGFPLVITLVTTIYDSATMQVVGYEYTTSDGTQWFAGTNQMDNPETSTQFQQNLQTYESVVVVGPIPRNVPQ